MSDRPTRLPIRENVDVQRARRLVRAFASSHGLAAVATDELVLAVTEVVRNVVKFSSSGGQLDCDLRELRGYAVLQVRVEDSGPGIPDLDIAMTDGFSTGDGLGSGLPAARRLVDRFEISSSPAGTTVTLGKRISKT